MDWTDSLLPEDFFSQNHAAAVWVLLCLLLLVAIIIRHSRRKRRRRGIGLSEGDPEEYNAGYREEYQEYNYQMLQELRSLRRLETDVMDGAEFERYLSDRFCRLGYHVELTPETYDFGADLILTRGREKTAVQAKRYNTRLVGLEAVQQVTAALAFYQADRGMVVTNSFFTQNAIKLAQANDIELWDRYDLIERLHTAEIEEAVRKPRRKSRRHCPVCGAKLEKKRGRNGTFIGCSNFPVCRYTRSKRS